MADVLKQTLYWNANPSRSLTDNDGSGNQAETRVITAAESHDGSDSTYEGVSCQGDSVTLEGDASVLLSAALQTASATGAISFIRMKWRGRAQVSVGIGTVDPLSQVVPRINGTNRGSAAALASSFTDYSQDFSTDPADSNAWTNAKVNAQTFGVELRARANDEANFSTGVESRMAEFSVELWGPAADTVNAPSAGVAATPTNPTLVAGARAIDMPNAPVTASPAAQTLVPGAMTMAPAGATVASLGLDEVWTNGGRDPLAPVDVDVFVDAGTTPIRLVRSDTAPFDDGSDATKTLTSSPGTWPNSGTITFDFHGTDGTTSLDGTGPIAGVKLYVRLRARKDTNAVLNNFRTQFGGQAQAFTAQPTVWPMLPAAGYYETLQTALIPLGSNGVPFEWGQGVNSVFTQATMGWRLFADYSVGGAYSGQFAQVECADAWLEVYGFNGSEPEVITLKQKIGDLRRVQTMQSVVSGG